MKEIQMRVVLFLVTALTFVGCSTYSVDPMSSSELRDMMQQARFTATNGVSFCYRAYYPDVQYKVPVVFYLHGMGQRGTDNSAQLDSCVGSVMSVTTEKQEYSAAVIAPQCPGNMLWRDDVMLQALSEFIDSASTDKRIDRNRVYVTGFSMGGDATWKLAITYPGLLSTVMPVCGGPLESMEPDRPDIPPETADLNIWAFNNFDDFTVRPNFSKYVFSRLWSYKLSDSLNFTESVSGGHDPTDVYRNRKCLIWMLSTKRQK